jgi:hypothetical protein
MRNKTSGINYQSGFYAKTKIMYITLSANSTLNRAGPSANAT